MTLNILEGIIRDEVENLGERLLLWIGRRIKRW